MMARAAVSGAAVMIALLATGRLVPALIALASARLAVLLLYDVPVGSRGEQLARTGRTAQRAILRAALPLGLVLMLVSLNTNLPRYAIERRLGTPALGAFAAAASFMTAGNTIVNALGQSATPRLARYFAEAGRTRFLRLVWQLAALAVAIGAAGVAFAAVAAATLLRILYRPEFAQHTTLLVQVMASAIPAYVAAILGYAITSARAFDAQLPLFCVVAASCGIAAGLLVPRFGLAGAPMALGIAACVQICGAAAILHRALHRAEPLR
jgi:O-antigen/teichoic acid export membrane protein